MNYEEQDDFVQKLTAKKATHDVDLSHLPKCLAKLRIPGRKRQYRQCGRPVKYCCEFRCEDCWVADVYRKKTGFFAEG